MDLRRVTLEIAEHSGAVQEDRSRYKKQLEESEEYLNQIRDVLKEKELESTRKTEVLEINNSTKSAFNEHYKEAKTLIFVIFNSLRQIEETVSSISETENSLDDVFSENTERLKKMEINFIDFLSNLEIKEEVIKEKISKERAEIQEKIKTVELEIEEDNEFWENALEEYEEQEKKLQVIKLEVEALEETIEKESHQFELLMNDKKEIDDKILEEINHDIEISKKLQAVEEDILSLTAERNEIEKGKAKVAQKRSETQKTLQQIRQECANYEKLIVETKDHNEQRLENLTKEIELKHKLTEEKRSELCSREAEIDEYNKEIEEITSKFSSIDEEIISLQQTSTRIYENIDEAKENLKKITQETERLKQESENLERTMATIEENNSKKQKELDKLKSTPNLELLEIKEKLAALEAEKTKTKETEKEIAQIEQENKSLQQTAEQQQIALQDYTARKIQLELELEENIKELKNVTKQWEDSEKEVQRVEALKRESLNVFPKPPAKRTRFARKTAFTKNKFDFESDSSIDGESLSYTDFMAKKKKLQKQKQNKK